MLKLGIYNLTNFAGIIEMKEKIYIVINESDAYHTSVSEFKSMADAEEYISNYQIENIKVYESRRMHIEKSVRISIV